jgi:hypothetical protein
MAMRDLTFRFKQARSAADRGKAGGKGAEHGYDQSMLVAHAPEYVDTVDSINEIIADIERKSESGSPLDDSGCHAGLSAQCRT